MTVQTTGSHGTEPGAELTDREARIKSAIERGRAAAVEIGRELEAIRVGRLYRPRGYPSFDAYLRGEWQVRRKALERGQAYRVMQFARVQDVLSPIGDKLPASEAVARELVPLLPAAPRVEGDDRGGTHGWQPPTTDYLVETWRAVAADPRRTTANVVAEHVRAQFAELERQGVWPVPVSIKPTQADVVERIRAAAVTVELGDLYAIGPHRLICGDTTDPLMYERLLGAVRPNLLFSDPPYNQHYIGSGGKHPFDAIANDQLSDTDAFSLIEAALVCARSHLADDAAGYICAPSSEARLLKVFLDVLESLERIWAEDSALLPGPQDWQAQVIFWDKGSMGLGSRRGYRGQHEAILYMRGASEWYGGNGQRDASDVWSIACAPSPHIHPTQKPVELIERAMLNRTPAGAAVLDPFLGSGATVIALHLLTQGGDEERPVFGIELEPKELEHALGWIEHHTGYSRTLLERAPAETDQARSWRELPERVAAWAASPSPRSALDYPPPLGV